MKPCQHCGTLFYCQPFHDKPGRYEKKYCSVPCAHAYRERPDVVAARFWAKVEKAEGDACWIWQGARSSVSGYATFCYLGTNINGHRAAWLITYGPIEGKDIDVLHTCNNGHIGCVRPSHMKLGTHKENMADKIAAGRSCRGEKSPSAKLTEQQAREILSLKGTAPAHALCGRYGVGPAALQAIWRGDYWKHIQPAEIREALEDA